MYLYLYFFVLEWAHSKGLAARNVYLEFKTSPGIEKNQCILLLAEQYW